MLYANNKQISGRQASRILFLALFAAACMTIPEIAIAGGYKQALIAVMIGIAVTILYTWLIVRVMACDCVKNIQMEVHGVNSDKDIQMFSHGFNTDGHMDVRGLNKDKDEQIRTYKFDKNKDEQTENHRFNSDFMDILQICFGRHAAQGILIYFWIKFIVAAIYTLRMFWAVISQTFLTEISGWLIALMAAGAAFYIASRGIETEGRLSEIITWIAVIPIFIVIALSMSQLQISRLVLLHIENTSYLLQNSARVWTALSSVEILLFLLPYVKKTQRRQHYFLCDVAVAGAVALLVLVACIGVLSAPGTAAETWPSVILMQIVKLPWHFISRQEGVLLGFWMPAAVMLLAGYLLFSNHIARKILPTRCKKWTALATVILVYFGTLTIRDFKHFEAVYLKWQFWLGILPTLVLLIVILLRMKRTVKNKQYSVQRRKRKTEGSQIRSLCRFVVLLGITALLSGCGKTPQIEDRNYVMALGIDYVCDAKNEIIFDKRAQQPLTMTEGAQSPNHEYKNDKYRNNKYENGKYKNCEYGSSDCINGGYFKITMSFPDVGALTGNDGPEPEAPMTLQVKNLQDIEEVYENMASQKLDFGQLQVILLGQNVLKQQKILKTVADYMQQHQAFTRTTYICATKNDSRQVIALDTEVNGSVGIYIKDMIENNYEMQEKNRKACILNDFIIAVENSTERADMNVIDVEDNKPVIINKLLQVGNSKF